ncbi:hypothetical protein BH10BDE1_BH10BDE1_18060 [soil metagenome]
MTHVTFSKVLAAAVFVLSGFVSAKSFAIAPMSATPTVGVVPSALKTDSAEFCSSTDGRFEIVRDFTGGENYLVLAPQDATSKPIVKQGFTYVKQAGGVTQKNEVTFEMFELMVEPFDNEPKDQSKWAKTYEELFNGKVAIVDDKGKTIATVTANCHAAVVDFK